MKITLPESIADVALHQFQKYDELLKREDLSFDQFNKRKINIFTGIAMRDVNSIIEKDYKLILDSIDKALNEASGFQPIFNIQDVEFGFIPNFDNITMAEYRDITEYSKEMKDFHKLMAVLFRPVIKKDSFNNYKIEKYNGTSKRADVMKYMPMSVVNGALVFFSSLANELVSYTAKYMVVEQAREEAHQTTLKNGGGMQRLKNWLKAKFGK